MESLKLDDRDDLESLLFKSQNDQHVLEQEVARLQQENLELRSQLQNNLNSHQYLQEVKQLLRDKAPSVETLIELSLKQEREQNEVKNRKVLEILRIKDSMIEELEGKLEEQQNIVMFLQNKSSDSKVLVSNTEATLKSAYATVADLKHENFEKNQIISQLKQQLDDMVVKLQSYEGVQGYQQKIAELEKQLANKESEHDNAVEVMQELTQTVQHLTAENQKLKIREEYVMEWSQRQYQNKEQQDSVKSEHSEQKSIKLEQENSELKHIVQSLEKANEDLNKDMLQLAKKLENNELIAHTMSSQTQLVSRLNARISTLRMREEQAVNSAAKAEEQVSVLKRQLEAERNSWSEEKSVLQKSTSSKRSVTTAMQTDDRDYRSTEVTGGLNELTVIQKLDQLEWFQKSYEQAVQQLELYKKKSKEVENHLQAEVESYTVELHFFQEQAAKADAKANSLQQSNSKLREEIQTLQNAIMAIQMGMQAQAPAPSQESAKGKKPNLKLEPQKRPQPQNLVKALVLARMGEAEACQKLRQSAQIQASLQDQHIQLQQKLRQFEAKYKAICKFLQTNNIPNPIYEEADKEAPLYDLSRRLYELESEIAELHLAEANGWVQFKPISNVIINQSESYSDNEFTSLITGIMYLTEQLTQMDKATTNPSPEKQIELAQRSVIRALTRSLNKLTRGDENLIQCVPTRDEDRQVWYLEVLEAQLESVKQTLGKLVEFSNQLSVEISGNMAASASYKGASMELTKSTNETAKEIEILKQVCWLIREDLSASTGKGDEFIYKERAAVAEGMKKKLEDEVVAMRLEHSYEVAELEQQLSDFEERNKELRGKLQEAERNVEELAGEVSGMRAENKSLKSEVRSLEGQVGELQAELQTAVSSGKTSEQQTNKVQNMIRKRESDFRETLKTRDTLIDDLQKQIMSLQQEKAKLNSEIQQIKKSRKPLPEKDPQTEQLQLELQEAHNRLANIQQGYLHEKQQMNSNNQSLLLKLKQLEESNTLLKNQLKKKKKHKSHRSRSTGRAKTKSPVDQELQEHVETLAKFTMKKEHSAELDSLKQQVSSLQFQIREKILELDAETRRRLTIEEQLKILQTQQNDSHKYTLKNQEQTQNTLYQVQQTVEQLKAELTSARQERDDLIGQISKGRAQIGILSDRLSEEQASRERIQSESESNQKQLSLQLQQEQNAAKRAAQQLQSLQEYVRQLENSKSAIENTANDLETKLHSKIPQIKELQGRNSALMKEVNELRAQLSESQKQRQDLEEDFRVKLQEIYSEMQAQFHEYENSVDLYEQQIQHLKELYTQEFRAKKVGKKATETVDHWVQLSRKEAVIKSLRQELKKRKKPARQNKLQSDSPDQIVLQQMQINQLKTKLKTTKAMLQNEREAGNKLKSELESQQTLQEEIREKGQASRKEINQIERRHREEMQRLAEEVQRMRNKWKSPEEFNALQNNFRDLEAQYKKASDELTRKRELIENYRTRTDQQEHEANAMQDEIEQIKDISDKLRKMRLEINRKDKAIQDFKQTHEAIRENERKLMEENSSLGEKLKTLKSDNARKDAIIKDLRQKLESMSGEVEESRSLQDQLEKAKEQVRKYKNDCDRKDTQIKSIKSAYETTKFDFEQVQQERSQLASEVQSSIEKESRRSDKLSTQMRQKEYQLGVLYSITKRIFQELENSIERLRGKANKKLDRQMFTDCLNILNMSMDELSEFVQPSRSSGYELLDQMLERSDTEAIVDLFHRLVSERVELEKCNSDTTVKYENYINRMKNDMMQQKKHYEERIRALEGSVKRR